VSIEITLAVLLAALLHASWNAMIKGGSDALLDTAAIVAGAGALAQRVGPASPLRSRPIWRTTSSWSARTGPAICRSCTR
jgi:hypothetical protein